MSFSLKNDWQEKFDQPSGSLPLNGPLGQSSLRGLPGNPAQGRRAGQNGSIGAPLPPPPPLSNSGSNIRSVASSSSLSNSGPLSPQQVIGLAREAMRDALRDSDQQAGDTSGVTNEMKPGLTIDLSRKNIQKLPDEVVDIIKNELERLALSHNKLASFPARFAECSSLRYLNVRNNDIREFPLPLCDLKSLEILDLGRNKLSVLPPEIVKLASLKVFSVQKNRIEELPLCLADMASLQMLKLDGNPIRFPPPEVFQVQAGSPSMEGVLKESEVTEVTVTSYLKKYLKQKAMNGRLDSDTGGDESSEGTETPRMPIKRVVSGRFPIKVNGTDMGDLRSPAFPRPPPIPTRSHYRGLSQQSTGSVRRPGVMPLTIGNANERVRSNSETLLQARSEQQSAPRTSRRMAIVPKKAQELATLDEMEANNRFSHYRGLSHGSAMQGNGNITNSKSPASPADMSRPVYIRRLSILPERRRESKFYDPVLEAAKGVLYSVFQIHPMIQMLMSLTSDGSPKRSSLEIVVYNTNSHVQELEREIQMHDPANDGQELGFRENESVHRACMTLVAAYAHICSLLAKDVDLFIENGDPRYIRTLLVQLYNSIMELRVTTSQLSPDENYRDDGYRATANKAAINDTIKPHSRQSSVTPTADRPTLSQRAMTRNFVHNPSNLRVATDVPMSVPYINGTGRTATITSATPRSGESFASNSSRGMTSEFTEEDQKFEKIFLSLQKSTDLVMRILPGFYSQFQISLRNAAAARAPEHVLHSWRVLNAACSTCCQQTETLKSRLSNIKLKEPGIRTQDAFWTLCHNFIESWAETGRVMRQALVVDQLNLPPDTRSRLRPIQLSMKQTMELVKNSPWGYILLNWTNSLAGNVTSPLAQVPMTPQSAALGPAVQATVPSTPQSASFANAFSGGVFERAGALINNGGLSMHSRGNTGFSSMSGSSMGSISSTVSSMHGGDMTPSTVLSPNSGMGPFPLRLSSNQGGKVAF